MPDCAVEVGVSVTAVLAVAHAAANGFAVVAPAAAAAAAEAAFAVLVRNVVSMSAMRSDHQLHT